MRDALRGATRAEPSQPGGSPLNVWCPNSGNYVCGNLALERGQACGASGRTTGFPVDCAIAILSHASILQAVPSPMPLRLPIDLQDIVVKIKTKQRQIAALERKINTAKGPFPNSRKNRNHFRLAGGRRAH